MNPIVGKKLLGRKIDSLWRGSNTGTFKPSNRLRDDVYVIRYYDRKTGKKEVVTLQGMTAIRNVELHKHDKGFDFRKFSPPQTAADVYQAEREFRRTQ